MVLKPGGFGANALVLIYHRQVHVVDGDPGRDFHFELRIKNNKTFITDVQLFKGITFFLFARTNVR